MMGVRGLPDHGTDAGWQHHRLLGQAPCPPCREARNADRLARRWAPRAGLTLDEWHALGHDAQQDLICALRIRPPRLRDPRTHRFVSAQAVTT